jgi:integrase
MEKIANGFDRSVDFKEKKIELISTYEITCGRLNRLPLDDRYYESKKRKIINRLLYLIIAMTQLINGSRISEACSAVRKFLEEGNLNSRMTVKIAKSESVKYKKDTKEQYITKVRYRHMIYPLKWVLTSLIDNGITELKNYLSQIEEDALKKRVLDYLLKHHHCNTHSLRYAFINYMLYTEKKEPAIVAKHVGHSNLDQIVRYTQKKESDKLFDMDL